MSEEKNLQLARKAVQDGVLTKDQARACLSRSRKRRQPLHISAYQLGFLDNHQARKLAPRPEPGRPKTLDLGDPESQSDEPEVKIRLPALGEIFHGYEIRSLLGRGGMGAVFRARKEGKDYALKVIRPRKTTDERIIARFEREARTTSKVDQHPNIVTIHTLDLECETPYIVMELIEGKSLDKLINPKDPWVIEDVLKVFGPLAEALDHMHAHGIIHRDLKPANILIREDQMPFLTDFGLVKALEMDGLTRTGETVGTPMYMSPEQFTSREISAETDVWALGFLAYQLLTGGKRPFPGKTAVAVAQKVLRDRPIPMTKFVPDIDPLLEQVVCQAMNKHPQDRFPSATAFYQALETYDVEPGIIDSLEEYKGPAIVGGLGLICLLLIILTLRACIPGGPTQQTLERLKDQHQSLNRTFRSESQKAPEHLRFHLIQSLVKSAKANDRCEVCTRLRSHSGKLYNEASQILQSSDPIFLSINRLHSEVSSLALLDSNDEKDFTNEALKRLPKDDQAMLEGYQLFLKERYREALSKFLAVPEKSRWLESVHIARALAALESGRFSESVKHFKELPSSILELTALQRFHYKAQAFKADLQKKRGRAIRYFFKLTRIDPKFKVPPGNYPFDNDNKLIISEINTSLHRTWFVENDHKVFLETAAEIALGDVYLDIVDKEKLKILDNDNLLDGDRFKDNPVVRFWNLTLKLESAANERLKRKNLEKTIKKLGDLLVMPEFPRAYKSGAHFHRALFVWYLDMRTKVNFPSREKCLYDLSTAIKLAYPKGDLAHLAAAKIIRFRRSTTQSLSPYFIDLSTHLREALHFVDQRRKATKARQLTKNRPPGIPFHSLTEASYNATKANIYLERAEVHVSMKRLQDAENAIIQSWNAFPSKLNTPLAIRIFTKTKNIPRLRNIEGYLIRQRESSNDKHSISQLIIVRNALLNLGPKKP